MYLKTVAAQIGGFESNLLIISFPPAYGGGKRKDFNHFKTRPKLVDAISLKKVQ
jgi:hypothetical protein